MFGHNAMPTALSGLLLLGLTSTVNAATSTSWINDHNSDGTPNGTQLYEIQNMSVAWKDNNEITVKVYTDFAGHASREGSKIGYGDLLIGTTPIFDKGSNTTEGTNWADTGTDWDYAFRLDQVNDDHSGARHDHGNISRDGWLVKYQDNRENWNDAKDKWRTKNKNTAGQWTSSAGKPDEIVTSEWNPDNTVGANDGKGSWSAKTDEYLSFTFNVDALGLSTPSQLAFRWAMTCANDIIDGVAYSPHDGNSNNQIPEPAVLTLMLAGIAGVSFTRRRKVNHLAA